MISPEKLCASDTRPKSSGSSYSEQETSDSDTQCRWNDSNRHSGKTEFFLHLVIYPAYGKRTVSRKRVFSLGRTGIGVDFNRYDDQLYTGTGTRYRYPLT